MNPRKWYMQHAAINPFLCHADGAGGEGEGEGGGGADPAAKSGENGEPGGGEDDKGGKGSLGDHFKSKDKGSASNPLDNTPPPKDGGFDMAQLPEAYRGESADEALGKVFGKLKEYESQAEARGKAPARAEDYPLKLNENASKYFDVENDPVIAHARKFALKQGMGTGEFQNSYGPLLESLAESGLIEQPVDPEAEAAKLGDDGPKLFSQAEGYVGRLKAKLTDLDGAEKAELGDVVGELELALETAQGVRLINYMAKLGKEEGPGVPGDVQVSGQITAEKIREMRKDPRADTRSQKYDPAFRKRLDDMAKALHGD